MNGFAWIMFFFAILSSCATTVDVASLGPEDQAYASKVNSMSNAFEVDKARSEEVWSRGNSFISRFSGMKIRIANESRVETFDPNSAEFGTIGYELTKELTGNSVKFNIRCIHKSLNAKYTEDVCRNNEKVMAHYMLTGELKENFINAVIAGKPEMP